MGFWGLNHDSIYLCLQVYHVNVMIILCNVFYFINYVLLTILSQSNSQRLMIFNNWKDQHWIFCQLLLGFNYMPKDASSKTISTVVKKNLLSRSLITQTPHSVSTLFLGKKIISKKRGEATTTFKKNQRTSWHKDPVIIIICIM